MSMTSTGWRDPSEIKQNTKNVNGYRKCYSFTNLNNITRDDTSFAYIPRSGGIDSNHKSPEVYCSGYNFNIPNNATITKISIMPITKQYTDSRNGLHRGEQTIQYEKLKLKITSSTTDGGYGTNHKPSYKLPYKKWITEDNAIISITDKTELNKLSIPAINSANFGLCLQWKGLYNKAWTTPAISKVRIKIEYALPTASSVSTKDMWTNQAVTIESKTLDISKPDDGLKVVVSYTHKKGSGGNMPTTTASSTDLLLSDKTGKNKKTYYTLPNKTVASSDSETVASTEFYVYPGTLIGTHTVTIKAKDFQEYAISIKVTITGNSSTEMSNSEKEKYLDGSQRCIILNSTFTGNTSKRGGAVYTNSEQYYASNNSYKSNTATEDKCPNVWNKGNCESK